MYSQGRDFIKKEGEALQLWQIDNYNGRAVAIQALQNI